MQTICTALYSRHNHSSTSSLNFYRPGALPDVQPAVSDHLRTLLGTYTILNYPRESFREGLCNHRRWFVDCLSVWLSVCLFVTRAYFNVPTGTDMLGDLKSVLEGLLTRA